jgi:predicted DNA-binding antitoxin AbrB/MazE fold protein
MGLTVEATFENGVFVPVERPGLQEHERVRLTIEPVAVNSSGLEDIRRRRGRRIRLDAELAHQIASSPEFDLGGSWTMQLLSL